VGAHWHHLANTTELSMCCGDAAFYQIILVVIIFVVITILSPSCIGPDG